MTPAEFNALCERIIEVLRRDPAISDCSFIQKADESGAAPEIGLNVAGFDVALVVEVV